jgi:hypothetical protein
MARLSVSSTQPKGNQSRAAAMRGAGWARPESWVAYPKPVDLYVGRLKPGETQVEDRTDNDVQIFLMTCA